MEHNHLLQVSILQTGPPYFGTHCNHSVYEYFTIYVTDFHRFRISGWDVMCLGFKYRCLCVQHSSPRWSNTIFSAFSKLCCQHGIRRKALCLGEISWAFDQYDQSCKLEINSKLIEVLYETFIY